MFDDFREDRPLPERVRKGLIVGAVALLLVVGGFTLVRDAFTDDEDQQTAQQPPESEPTDGPTDGPAGEPGTTGRGDTGRVEDWFPHSRDEFAAAGQTAEEFLSATATIDYDSDDFDDHADSLSAWTDDTHATTLTTPSGIAEGIWRVLGQEEEVTAWTGQARVDQVRSYGSNSVEFLLDLEATPAQGGNEQQTQELGSYQVVTVNDGGWQVEFSDRRTE